MFLQYRISSNKRLFNFRDFNFCLFYEFDRFVGLISLEKGLFRGYWGVGRRINDYTAMFSPLKKLCLNKKENSKHQLLLLDILLSTTLESSAHISRRRLFRN